MTRFLSSIQPTLPSMPQATIQGYVGCTNSVYNQFLTGNRVHLVVTAFLLKKIWNWMECEACMLHKFSFFLSFTSHHIPYPCALVQWFVIVGDAPCSDTGMWIVRPKMENDSTQATSIIHVDSNIRGAHLIGVYGEVFLPCDFSHFDALIAFQAYYVNKFINYHTNEIAF